MKKIIISNIILMNKDEIIAKIYLDPAGFGSNAITLQDARKFDKSITLQDVKNWKAKNLERKTNLKGYNSFVADKPFQEFQIDLFFLPDLKQTEIGGLLFIDIFTKYVSVIPILSKQPTEILEALKQGFNKMGGKPETMFTDNEGSFNANIVIKYLKDNNIRQIFTLGHAAFAERAIRTIKGMIYKRVEHTKQKWVDVLYPVLLTYNNKLKSSITGMTPSEARDPKNQIDVGSHLEIHRMNKRKYPNINVGDWVKLLKKKTHFEKENISVWSPKIHEVLNIVESHGQKFYKVSNYDKMLLRSDILLNEEMH